MKRVACIGTKEPSTEEQNLLIKIGGWLALQGYTVSSGNAAGSERFFALGASMVNPRLVELHLPWEDYNPEFIFLLNQVIVEPDSQERQMLVTQLHPNGQVALPQYRPHRRHRVCHCSAQLGQA